VCVWSPGRTETDGLGAKLYKHSTQKSVLDRYWTVDLQLIYSTGPVRSTRRWTVRSLVLDLGLGMLYAVLACHWVVVEVTYFLRRYSLMLGHRLDACASHLMLCASFWMSSASSVMLGHRLMRVHCVWSLVLHG